MRSELIISTYNSPHLLALSLASVSCQDRPPDAVVVADDGSGPETRAVLDAFESAHPDLPLRHVWHPDNGFQKNAILNRAIAGSEADHLVFIDGDCLCSRGFFARHVAMARPDGFATGSLIRLSPQTTEAMTVEDIRSGRAFDRDWLRRRGELAGMSRGLKSSPFPAPVMHLLDRLSPIRPTWSGSNASAFRAALLAVNGFDETMKYGGEDKELGARLRNAGYRGRHLRYSAPLLHLDHGRDYVSAELVAANRARIRQTRRSGRTWADAGITGARHTSPD